MATGEVAECRAWWTEAAGWLLNDSPQAGLSAFNSLPEAHLSRFASPTLTRNDLGGRFADNLWPFDTAPQTV